MKSKIRVLSDHTINKIAAGEVIENPASVVKELVENSLDAGAKEIYIEITGGGRQMIRISDNGCGMNGDDALLCLERHATSKIREVEEIHAVTTMGFRGEAIPSIASISKFTILTCPEVETGQALPIGTMVIIDGGKLISCTPAARSQGTTIEVKSLFFNVPVRKKFLKSPAVDANEILKTVSLMSLGYPEVKFQLINDGKMQLTTALPRDSSFSGQLKARISDVLGGDYLQNVASIEGKNDLCQVNGVVGLPSYTRHNRTGQYLFINKRGVVSPLVAYAVKDGLGTSLAVGRHPVFVLHLTIPGDLVDVNVHPQKREVRLRQEQAIKEIIVKSVEGILRHDTSAIRTPLDMPAVSPVFANHFRELDSASHASEEVTDHWVFKPKPHAPEMVYAPPKMPHPIKPPASMQATFDYSKAMQPGLPVSQSNVLVESPIMPPKVMATISRFILLEGGAFNEFIAKGCPGAEKGGIIVLNQKAAHFRIIFERLLQNDAGNPIAQQALLVPHQIEVSPFEAEMLRGCLGQLHQIGIHIQEFGAHTFLIDAVPQIFGNSDIEKLVSDLIHSLRETGEQQMLPDRVKQVALAASRAAVSQDRRLTIEEAQGLVNQLVKCRQPYQCPMGKSTIAQIASDELLKLFLK